MNERRAWHDVLRGALGEGVDPQDDAGPRRFHGPRQRPAPATRHARAPRNQQNPPRKSAARPSTRTSRPSVGELASRVSETAPAYHVATRGRQAGARRADDEGAERKGGGSAAHGSRRLAAQREEVWPAHQGTRLFFFSAACGRRLRPVLLLPASRSQEAVQYEKVRAPHVADAT